MLNISPGMHIYKANCKTLVVVVGGLGTFCRPCFHLDTHSLRGIYILDSQLLIWVIIRLQLYDNLVCM